MGHEVSPRYILDPDQKKLKTSETGASHSFISPVWLSSQGFEAISS